MANSEYTSLWTDNFDVGDVQQYDSKFRLRWEKNIKHRAQIEFIRKYLEDWMYWCDAPIGSGRLMRELQTDKMLGFDISDSFLEYNRRLGIDCQKGDLFEFGDKFKEDFDFITSLHSIFAFPDYRSILVGFIHGLKPGGILIVDITNKRHSDATGDIKNLIFEDAVFYPEGMTRDEINEFFGSRQCEVLEILRNDFWDNYFFFNWRYIQGNRLTKWLKKNIWNVVNFLYFRFNLTWIFCKFETSRPDYQFTKYLVAVKKKS
jgi:hypothetical protein